MPWKEVSIMSQRLEFVTLAAAEAANIRQLCRCYGISSATAYKWLQRFQHSGGNGLADRSRRPHHSPSRSAAELEDAVVKLRRQHPAWGGRKLRQRLLALNHTAVPSASTITAILRRQQLLDPKESAKHRPCQRFERAAPNELWQMDFKGEFKLPQGRCYPLTILDDHSRFAIALEACARNTRNITQTALIKVFRLYGLPQQITCDNGAPWGARGRHYFTGLGVWLTSQRRYPEHLPPLEYGPDDLVRKVRCFGHIKYQGREYHVGSAFKHLYVALRPTTSDGLFDVFFCNHKIGKLDLRDNKLS